MDGVAAAAAGAIDTERDPIEDSIEHPVSGSVALKAWVRPAKVSEPGGRAADHEEDERRLRVAPPAPVRAPKTPFIVLVLVLVIAGFVGILVLNTKINENVFKLDKLQASQATLDVRENQLQADIAQQAAPGTVAGKARELGMQQPTKPPTFIVLPDGRQLDVPQPAVGK